MDLYTTIRGLPENYASGKIKILIDGIPVNATLHGQASPIFNLPLEQVESIEFIRGPGSGLYGKWALLGVLNVKTKSGSSNVFVRGGSFKAKLAGSNFFWQDPQAKRLFRFSVAAFERGDQAIIAGKDELYGTPNESVSRAPGKVDDQLRTVSAICEMKWNHLGFNAVYASRDLGPQFGNFSSVLPPRENAYNDQERLTTLKTRWTQKLSTSLKLDSSLGWRYLFFDSQSYVYPPGWTAYGPGNTPLFTYTDGILGGPHFEEEAFFGDVNLHYHVSSQHRLLFGMEYEFVRMLDTWSDNNVDFTGPFPLPVGKTIRFTGESNWLAPHKRRKIFGAFFQDQIKIANTFSLTPGLRYDVYSDTGDSRITPRIAAVYPFTRKTIRDVLPENNIGCPIIPQILTDSPKDFIHLAQCLFDLGYAHVNWNLGCPYPIVAKKGRGSGMLPFPSKIDGFLEQVIPRIPNHLSIKTRLGRQEPSEILTLLPVFNRYPLTEITIHPRTGIQMYKGTVDLDLFEACLPGIKHPVVYNGDIDTLDSYRALAKRFPRINRFMLGRGIVADPFLPSRIKGSEQDADIDRIRAFHDTLFANYQERYAGPAHLIDKMKGIWAYLSRSFANGPKFFKKIKKVQRLDRYLALTESFFQEG